MDKHEEPSDYGTAEFWEFFLQKQMKMIPENEVAYKNKGSFTYDWYVEANEIIPQMEKFLKPEMQVISNY